MTAEQYVKEVGKLLKCRASKRKEIKSQLLAEINSATAKGDKLEDVLKRMGIAWDCANRYNDRLDMQEQRAAKRERTLKIWGIVLAIVIVLCTFAYQNLPRWGDINKSTIFREEQVSTETEDIIRLYSNDDFQAVYARMNGDMKGMWNEALLAYIKSQKMKDFGTLLSFEDVQVLEVKQDKNLYAMIEMEVLYSNGNVTYIITFDTDMKIAGFHVK